MRLLSACGLCFCRQISLNPTAVMYWHHCTQACICLSIQQAAAAWHPGPRFLAHMQVRIVLTDCMLPVGQRLSCCLRGTGHETHCSELYQRQIVSVLKQGEDLLMEEATCLWANSVQHTGLIVDHLMGKRWVSAAAILRWLFGPKATGMGSADDAMECLKCSDILYNTVARVLARTQV